MSDNNTEQLTTGDVEKSPSSPSNNGKNEDAFSLAMASLVEQFSGDSTPEDAFFPSKAIHRGEESEHEEIHQNVLSIAAEYTGVPGLDAKTSLMELGIASMALMALQKRLESEYEVHLGSTAILDYPTTEALATLIGSKLNSPAAPEEAAEKQKARAANVEAVAVIGMACRFPGGANDIDAYWSLLSNGEDPIAPIPENRWSKKESELNNIAAHRGGFIDGIDQFDPFFFGLSPNETESLDPQQRLLLEVCHEALENAGANIPSLSGSRTGVFVGISGTDYAQIGHALGHGTGPYSFTGSMFNTAAGRISYVFGLQGPCLALDSACSSSLVSVHYGARELQSGSCDLVLAGAVNLMLKPDGHISYSSLNALSPHGRCASFDEKADGYVRSEGCGVVVLKRLSDAIRDGDRVQAVIRGSAVNHNGQSGGLTVPSGLAQEKVIREALKNGNVEPEQIHYVEAHGSGTKLGDPQEADALTRVFKGREKPLWIGSVKSNIGHTEAAAGMAGLIKLVLCLQHKQIAPVLHYKTPNGLIDWDAASLQVVDKLIEWEGDETPRMAGITSLGINGSNAHMILEEYSPDTTVSANEGIQENHSGGVLFSVSAKSEAGLLSTLEQHAHKMPLERPALDNWCKETQFQRSYYPSRYATFASSGEVLKKRITKYIEKHKGLKLKRSVTEKTSCKPRSIAFVFTGQGSTYPEMGKTLYQHSPVFRAAIEECELKFEQHFPFPLTEIITGIETHCHQDPATVQAIIFSIGYALSRFWLSLGIKPEHVIGHSIGEYAAAFVAGVISLDDAVGMVALRGEIMKSCQREGRMAGILTDPMTVQVMCDSQKDVWIAGINAPDNVTIAGSTEGVNAVIADAKARRIFTEPLPMKHAYHSPLMEDSAAELAEGIQTVLFAQPQMRFYSGITGKCVTSSAEVGSYYWQQHLCQPVRFVDAIETAIESGATNFIEIGGKATLSGLIAQIADVAEPEKRAALKLYPSLREGKDAWQQVNDSLSALFKAGADIDWVQYHQKRKCVDTLLPYTGQFRESYWFRDLTETIKETTSSITPSPQSDMSEYPQVTLAATTNESQVQQHVVEMICDVIGVDESEISDSTHLFALGMDSLMLVQLNKRLKKYYDVEIVLNDFFTEIHTPKRIADFVIKNASLDAIVDNTDRHTSSERTITSFDEQPQSTASLPQPIASNLQSTASQRELEGATLQSVIESQLAIMHQQLQLLGSTGGHPIPQGTITAQPDLTKAVADTSTVTPEQAKQMLTTVNVEEPELSEQQRSFIHTLSSQISEALPLSKAHAEKYRPGMADWLSGLNFSASLKEMCFPVVVDTASGARFKDLDGHEYIDLCMGYGVNLFGHNPDFVKNALLKQIEKGYALGPQSDQAGEVATIIRELTGVERVTFSNTGTEAVMAAMRVSRAATGKQKIVRFSNAYHGTFDGVLAEAGEERSQPAAGCHVASLVEDTLVVNYGTQASLEAIEAQADHIAAVLVEPVQSRNPALQPSEYLKALRALTQKLGIVLIFDEMILGFRCHSGGAQAFFDIRADLVTYGKIVGGGMPIGVVAGKAALLDHIDGGHWQFGDDSLPSSKTTVFAGTFCKHPLTMAAAHAVLSEIKKQGPALQQKLNLFTEEFAHKANALCRAHQIPMVIKPFASMFRIETLPSQEMDKLGLESSLFFKLLQQAGIFCWERRVFVFSTAHTQEDINAILDAMKGATESLRLGGFSFRSLDVHSDGGAYKPSAFYPLSSEERRMYVLSQMKGGDLAYRICGAFSIEGEFDSDLAESVFKALANRHEALRTRYVIENGAVYRCVEPEVTPVINVVENNSDGSALIEPTPVLFDLTQAPLWWVRLVKHTPRTYTLFIELHHLIADGISLSLLMDDFFALYRGQQPEKLGLAYKEFETAEHKFIASDAYQSQREYWLSQLFPPCPPLNLPTDFGRPAINEYQGGTVHFELDEHLTKTIKQSGVDLRCTAFTWLLSSFFVLLSKLSQQNDISVGVPFDRRGTEDFERTLGMFAQTLVIRGNTEKALTFEDLVNQIRSLCGKAFDNSKLPLDKLVEELNVPRDMSRNALFDSMFIYEPGDKRLVDSHDLNVNALPVALKGSAFDVTLEIIDERGKLRCSFIYASKLFSKQTIESWKGYFINIVNQVIAEPKKAIQDIALMEEADKQQMLVAFNATHRDYDLCQTVPQLLASSFEANASKTAIQAADKHYSFRELDIASSAMAIELTEMGAGPGQLVGVMLARESAALVSFLAVLKTGAAYIPIDPDYPSARVSYMLDAANVQLLIAKTSLLGDIGYENTIVDPETLLSSKDSSATTIAPFSASELAYVIFTSGSTGTPKGVMVEHRSVVNFLLSMSEQLDLPSHPRMLGLTTVSFDIFVLELFLTLLKGGTFVFATEKLQQDPAALGTFIEKQNINVAQMTPSRLQLLLTASTDPETSLAGLQRLIVGGEAFKPQHKQALARLENLKVFNVYGPTETTVWSSIKPLEPTSTVTLGRPLANTRMYVLDKAKQLLPTGSKGDLYIAGDGLARGYLNDPQKTSEAYVSDPFYPGERMYKTGDIAAWTEDGELTYFGRSDSQIKLRGYRMELMDIEHALLSCDGIENGAVVLRDTAPNYSELVGFYTADVDVEYLDVRECLRQKLPEYMVPTRLIKLTQMPFTPNSKVDRNQLPQDIAQFEQSIEVKPTTEQPEDDDGLMAFLTSIWRTLLPGRAFNKESRFFDVGGNSMSIVFLQDEIEKRYPSIINVADIFAHPTLRQLRTLIESRTGQGEDRVPRVSLPDAFFTSVQDNTGTEGFALSLGSKSAPQLDSVAKHYGVKHFDVFIAVFALYWTRLTGQHQVSLLMASATDFSHLDLDLTGLEDVETLFNYVAKKRTGILQSLALSELEGAAIEGKALVLVSNQSYGQKKLSKTDIEFQFSPSTAEGDLYFNSSRLSEQEINQMASDYMTLLHTVIDASQG
ncbi:amino acid adenylation domain-containing protein [Vibrio sp. Of7-15]|uniref:non-ribosomal peptide synthetase/type I polyketide synthase n=1 Tax=Vibrio sp. Of7-15 TaxID=2724879 RepID=UPI001EF33060|nr:non-ribosomal peptide synthetase/type I polyketide synthase [Vibrio sp. Of7-15]MCG7495635.1 amino acid adenylation domain-containing protein [Vibrio sp. Of7-15]